MKRVFKFIIFFFILGIISCQQVTHTKKPKDLIPEDKMVDVLVDLAKLNAAIGLNANKFEERNVDGQELIMKKHNIDSTQLVQNIAYYAEQYKVNERIYENVTERLEEENDSLQKEEERIREEENKRKEEKED